MYNQPLQFAAIILKPTWTTNSNDYVSLAFRMCRSLTKRDSFVEFIIADYDLDVRKTIPTEYK